MRKLPLRHVDFQKLLKFDTCTVSNAIERLKGRLRNEGSVPGSVLRCQFPKLGPMLGYAATGKMRSTSAPVSGRAYHENMHWWRYVASIPEPRVMVIEDVDESPGAGALVGELHAVISRALNCIGYVTNGSVRDLPAVEAVGFHLFAGSVAVSHMYAHVSEYGRPVKIGGVEILPGDLIQGDRHGVHTIPLSIASDIPKMASEILMEERELKEFCQSSRFSLQGLDEMLQILPGDGFEVPLGAPEVAELHNRDR
jgi:4-hydroxy-4-methyl-2-oxoglutarate aldolase